MPSDPKECRLHALECARLAQSSASLKARDVFADLAKTWLRLACDIEASQALIDEWGDLPKKQVGQASS